MTRPNWREVSLGLVLGTALFAGLFVAFKGLTYTPKIRRLINHTLCIRGTDAGYFRYHCLGTLLVFSFSVQMALVDAVESLYLFYIAPIAMVVLSLMLVLTYMARSAPKNS